MTRIRSIPALILAFSLAACVQPETASRNMTSTMGSTTAPAILAPVAPSGGRLALQAQYAVQAVNVSVPRSLEVSEANSFLPKADIVWRGEPRGDRHAQVLAIFNEAMGRGTASMQSGPAVVVEVEVTRFHCLTEKTRFTVGGVHAMQFLLTVRDAATGQILHGPRQVTADIKASGGARAIAEDQAGRTQRVVVVERLAEVIRRELSAPIANPADLQVSRLDLRNIALSTTALQQ